MNGYGQNDHKDTQSKANRRRETMTERPLSSVVLGSASSPIDGSKQSKKKNSDNLHGEMQ